MAPIPTPIGNPIDCGLTLICAVCGARLGAGTARCRDPGVLFPIGSIHPSIVAVVVIVVVFAGRFVVLFVVDAMMLAAVTQQQQQQQRVPANTGPRY